MNCKDMSWFMMDNLRIKIPTYPKYFVNNDVHDGFAADSLLVSLEMLLHTAMDLHSSGAGDLEFIACHVIMAGLTRRTLVYIPP